MLVILFTDSYRLWSANQPEGKKELDSQSSQTFPCIVLWILAKAWISFIYFNLLFVTGEVAKGKRAARLVKKSSLSVYYEF